MSRARPTRRQVLGSCAALGCAPVLARTMPGLSASVALASPTYAGDNLVVLSLRGGFDGMSAVPPVGDPGYAAARPTIGVPASLAVPLSGVFGLHPALAPLRPLYTAGQLAVLHAVGQTSESRSHFQATADLETAAPGSSVRTGWLDRTLGLAALGTPLTPLAAVQMGSSTLPLSMSGPAPALSMDALSSFALSVWSGYQPAYATALGAMYSATPGPSGPAATDALAALSTVAGLPASRSTTTYPSSPLGAALKDLARLITSGVGLQIATVDVGNWDMHVNQGRPGDPTGWMARQLADLAACLVAFAGDLGPAMANVTVVTLSEFGRRVTENGDGGADHGHGNAMFVLGGGIRGGAVYGSWPGLSPAVLDAGDLPMATDYRTVLGEILTARCRIGSLSGIFPGLSYSPLGLAVPRS